MIPTNKHRKQGKSVSQTISKTNNANNDKQKIYKLDKEIKGLKTTQKITKETANTDQTKINNLPQ